MAHPASASTSAPTSAPTAPHTVRGACPHDCPDTCALDITVSDGRVVKVAGAADHPPTAGVLCTKVAFYPERIHHPERLLYPARRIGAKGPGARFERISWEEALATIADRFRQIAATDGAEAIVPYSYAGNSGLLGYGSMDRRFFHRLGASQLDRTICASAGAMGYRATIGASVGFDAENVVDARLIILWGTNSVVSNLHFWRLAQEARRRGARLIAIDPCRTATAEKCDQHVALLPGTDSALALGLMHVLIRDELLDADYIARYTLGFDALRERALQFAPARVAAICGISDPGEMKTSRTTTPVPARRQSVPTTASTARPAAAWRYARSPACRRSPAPGGTLPAACCCRLRATIRSTRPPSNVRT
jgi:anaerobic selenocysteine-containing dehydrogenase